jgi:hypothetical protein
MTIEDAVEAEDLQVKYLDYLSQIVAPDDYPFGYDGASYSSVWAIIRATEGQKQQALDLARFKLVRRKNTPVSLPTGQSISGAGLEDTQEG